MSAKCIFKRIVVPLQCFIQTNILTEMLLSHIQCENSGPNILKVLKNKCYRHAHGNCVTSWYVVFPLATAAYVVFTSWAVKCFRRLKLSCPLHVFISLLNGIHHPT